MRTIYDTSTKISIGGNNKPPFWLYAVSFLAFILIILYVISN